jgi:hypothetical protein
MPKTLRTRHNRSPYKKTSRRKRERRRLGIPYEDDIALVGMESHGVEHCMITTGRRWRAYERHAGRTPPKLPEGCWVVATEAFEGVERGYETFTSFEQAVDAACEERGIDSFMPHWAYLDLEPSFHPEPNCPICALEDLLYEDWCDETESGEMRPLSALSIDSREARD